MRSSDTVNTVIYVIEPKFWILTSLMSLSFLSRSVPLAMKKGFPLWLRPPDCIGAMLGTFANICGPKRSPVHRNQPADLGHTSVVSSGW